MTEDIGQLIITLVFLVLFVPMLFTVFTTVTDQIRGDYVEESEHNRIVNNLESEISALESNNSELRSDKQYLDNVISNYSENRSDLRQERNYYERLSENLSEENDALEEENTQLEDEVNRTVPIQRVIDYTLQVWNIHVKVVHVFAVSISVTFVITLSLVELNLFGWEGKISIKQGYEKLVRIKNRATKYLHTQLDKVREFLFDRN